LKAASEASVKALRDTMSWDIQAGEICIASFVGIEDNTGSHIATIHFADAVTVVTRAVCDPR
jgi:hypothetical protein